MGYGWTAYEKSVAATMQVNNLPGTAVALAVDGVPVMARGFGMRDREQGLPATENTVFGIGSITKSFTAVAIMQLVDEGKISVDDPVIKFIPEFRLGKAKAHEGIAIHHFLTHTSGMPPTPALFGCLVRSLRQDPLVMDSPRGKVIESATPIDTAEQLLLYLANLDIDMFGPPGMYFSYCNDGWGLLGIIIERVTGRSFAQVVKEKILDPLGMKHSAMSADDLDAYPEVTMLYSRKPIEGTNDDDILASPGWYDAPAMLAAGFLKSTVTDLLKYMEIYRTRGDCGGLGLLSPQSVDRMTMMHTRAQRGCHYGYGLFIHPNYHGASIVEHGGSLKGMQAQVMWLPEREITVASLTNLQAAPAFQIALSAVNTIMGLPVDTKALELAPYNCPAYRLGSYAGEYVSGEGGRIVVEAAAGGLDINQDGKKYFGRPVAVDTFAIKVRDQDQVIRFLPNSQGQYWAVEAGYRIVPRKKG